MVQMGSSSECKRRHKFVHNIFSHQALYDINHNLNTTSQGVTMDSTSPYFEGSLVLDNNRKSRKDQKLRKYRPGKRRSLSVGSKPFGRSPLIPRQPMAPQRRLSVGATKIKGVKFTSKQQWTLICLSIVSFTSMLSMSIIAPFFPLEASMKGMRETIYGFVFSVYALVIMIMSPIFGMIIPQVGAKFMLISGVFVAGASNILFGLLDKIEDLEMFTAFCFTVRIFEAVGAAAFSIASYTIIMQVFPDNIGTAFGIIETFLGLGFSLGPAVGGGLYSLGGYGLPFYILGSLMMLNLPLCFYLVKPIKIIKRTKNPLGSYLQLMSNPKILVVGVIVGITSQTVSFLDPTVEPHFRSMNISPAWVSLVFLLLAGAYTISSPIVGWFTSYIDNKFPVMFVGLFLICDGLLLLGPSFLLPIEPSLWLSVVAMIIIGIAYAIAFIPTFETILDLAIDYGFEDNITTYSLVSGFWNSMFSLGEVVGPTLGGLLDENFDYSFTVTVMASFSIFGALIAGFTCFFVGSEDDESSDTSSDDSSIIKSRSNRSSRRSSRIEKLSETKYLLQNSENHNYGHDNNKINHFLVASV